MRKAPALLFASGQKRTIVNYRRHVAKTVIRRRRDDTWRGHWRPSATLALISAAIALALSIMAWNKANDAWGNAQRALNTPTNR